MKDYPIGTVFTDSQGVKLEVVEEKGCDGCHYSSIDGCSRDEYAVCSLWQRADSIGFIFRPVEPQPACHFTQRNQVR